MIPKPNLIPRFNNDYNLEDFVYGFRSIFAKNNNDLNILYNIFNTRNIYFTNNGRSSLCVILRSLNLPKGSKIGVPLYSCTVVFDAIKIAGYTPCFIDIDYNNYTMDPRDLESKINEIRAIVVIHTFGRPADMDGIRAVAKGIPIIEDCAHSLMSEYKGKITGTIGDASLFSLGKYISAGGGGMIIADKKSLIDFQTEVDGLKKYSVIKEIEHSFLAYARSFLYHKPWFGLFALPIGLSIEDKIDIMNKRGFDIASINRTDLNILLKKMGNFKRKVELQRKNSFFLIEELKDTSLKLPYEMNDTYCNYYLFPIKFDTKKERIQASGFLLEKNIDTSKMYSETIQKAKKYYEYKGECPNTENCADTILTIPNYHTLAEDEILIIAETLKELI